MLDAGHSYHWSTEGMDPRRALACWTEKVCDRFLELDIGTPIRGPFHARLDQIRFGGGSISFLEADSQHVRRTAARIACTRYSGFILLQLRRGRALLKQQDRQVQLRGGECVLISGTESYDLACPQPTDSVALWMPGEWLTPILPRPHDHTAKPIAGSGWSAALCAAVGSLQRDTCGTLAVPPQAIAEQLATLLALAVGSAPAAGPNGLLEELLCTLRERLAQASLSPQAVADAHGISTRTLHYAFAAAHTTFTAQLMQLRLAGARDMLLDARLAALPIEDLAARCGFADPSHFARRFRQRYGQPPLQFRRAMAPARH